MPYYHCEIIAAQPRDVVIRRLRSVVQDEPPLRQRLKALFTRRDRGNPVFFGEVGRAHFRLYLPKAGYSNHFLPIINGHFTSTTQGTKIRVVMYLHPVAAIAVLILLLVMAVVPRWPDPPAIPWTLVTLAAVLLARGFYPEAVKARGLLERAVADDVS